MLEKYISEVKEKITKKSGLGRAVTYFTDHIEGFKHVFEDGRLELDNNAPERGIKDLIIGRKNWMFANTSKGADVTLLYYSLIKTCKMNNVNSQKYIAKLLKELPYKYQEGFHYKKYLPWNVQLTD